MGSTSVWPGVAVGASSAVNGAARVGVGTSIGRAVIGTNNGVAAAAVVCGSASAARTSIGRQSNQRSS
jgi:hypothetical protein